MSTLLTPAGLVPADPARTGFAPARFAPASPGAPPPGGVSRRDALRTGARGLLTLSLAGLLHRRGLADDAGAETLAGWFPRFHALGRDLAERRIDQRAWLERIGGLYEEVDAAALAAHVDVERVAAACRQAQAENGRGEVFTDVWFDGGPPRPGGDPRLTAITKMATIRKGASIPPHGHGNMVSAFLQLSGEFHVRQYDKLATDAESMTIRRTVDATTGAGGWSGISDVKNNLHWLTAKSDDCLLFTVKLIALDPDVPLRGRINVDARRSVPVTGHGPGAVRVPRISHREAAELYS